MDKICADEADKDPAVTSKKLLGECLRYFRERPVLGKLLRGFREKYLSYGRFAGTVTVRNLSESEREDLEGFLLRNYHGKKSASVSAERFERALSESRFAGISGKEALELYFQEPLEGKKEQKQREEEQWAALLGKVREEAVGLSLQWIEELKSRDADEAGGEDLSGSMFPAYLKKRYRESGKDAKEAEKLLKLGTRILNSLPSEQKAKEPVYLAVFAAEITGNPHAFDDGTKDGKYLELLIKWYIKQCRKGEVFTDERNKGFPSLKKQRLFLKAGILRDDVSNYALAAGIRAVGRDGRLHEGMEGFFREKQPVQIPLSVIAGWQSAFCPGRRLYIVENPSVYAILCDKWRQDCALMCMNGQPRLSSLLILELLAKSGTEVWYAGDIDPEGILIAQRLKRYYPGEFHYWHMSAEDYQKCMSGEEVSERRIKMLENITDGKLKETAEAVKTNRKAGYQENMAGVYLKEFEEI